MSILHYVDYHEMKLNKEHFVHLVKVAKSDGEVVAPEYDLLNRYGKNLGLTDPEIDMIIHKPGKSSFSPHSQLSQRFFYIYRIMKLIMVDGKASDTELHLANCYAFAAGFDFNEVDSLLQLLVQGIEKGLDEDDLFDCYMRQRMVA